METSKPKEGIIPEKDQPSPNEKSEGGEQESDEQPTNALERALAVAETMAPTTTEFTSRPAGAESLKESVSLKNVIDQVEQRLTTYFKSTGKGSQGLPEELDNLDIGVELGRPDAAPQNVYKPLTEYLTEEELEPASDESPNDDYGPADEAIDDEHDSVLPMSEDNAEWTEEEIEERMADSLSPFGSRRWSLPPELPALDFSKALGRMSGEKEDLDDSPKRALGQEEQRLDDRPIKEESDYQPEDSQALQTSVISRKAFPADRLKDLQDAADAEDAADDEEKEPSAAKGASTGPAAADAAFESAGLERVSPEEEHEGGLRLDRGRRLYGNLKEDRLWILLLALHVDRLSGALVLFNNNVERRLIVDKGDVVTATSSAREDRLTELLYREGRLNDDEYQQAVRAVGLSGRRAGAILVERGLIASRELYPVVRHHYESIVLDTFAWREGSWNYEPNTVSENARILLDIPIPILVMEGLRSRLARDDLDEIAPPHARPTRTPHGICQIDDLGLLPEEVSIYESCDGYRTIDDLASKFLVESRELSGFVAGLHALSLVEYDLQDDKPIPGKADRPSRTPGGYRDFRVERARVVEKLQQVNEGSYFALLEVAPDASGYEIRKAYREQRARFQAERFAVRELIDLQEEASLIRQILDEAYEVLRNPTLRELYRSNAG